MSDSAREFARITADADPAYRRYLELSSFARYVQEQMELAKNEPVYRLTSSTTWDVKTGTTR